MRMLRSIVYGLTAALVMACLTMAPASASVPIAPELSADVSAGKAHPAPAIVIQDVAVLPSEAPNIASLIGARSSLIASAGSFASSTVLAAQPYRHIDPGRMRS